MEFCVADLVVVEIYLLVRLVVLVILLLLLLIGGLQSLLIEVIMLIVSLSRGWILMLHCLIKHWLGMKVGLLLRGVVG